MAKTEKDSVEIKKKLGQMLPNMQFSVTREDFAGGHSVSIGIKGGNIQPYTKPEEQTGRYSINEYHYKDDNELTPKIKEIIAKVMDIAFSINDGFSNRHSSSYLHLYLGVSTRTKSEPYIYTPLATKAAKSSGTSTNLSRGELLKECGGWKVYKKTLPDGRIVYNATKDKETAPNKGDWDTIKSEVYMQSGFKWGRFGAFERWGSMTANDEGLIFNALCDVLTKYYGSNTPATPEPTTDEVIEVYVDGELIQSTKVKNEQEAFVLLNNNFGVDKFSEMSMKRQVFNDREAKKVWVFRESFYYGENFTVPKENGNLLQLYLAEKGFKVFIGAGTNNNSLVIYKTDFGDDKIIISDFNGDFNLNVYGDYKKFAGSTNYVIDKNPISPETLADLISDMYDNYFKNNKQDEPKEEPFKVNDSYRSLPANPKLDYCEIRGAEGLIAYADTFPKTFQSFTALTKYIADNIGEIPTQGYDKHRVEWKWKFSDSDGSGRWDVSETEANPKKYPNLYASEQIRKLCYDAWKLSPESKERYEESDSFYGEEVGKDGFELSTDQFNTILTDYLTLYPVDTKRFLFNQPEDRLEAFKNRYPKLIAAFEEQPINKAQLTKAIAGLEILAAKGNDKARKAIIGLKYLLNK